MFMIQVVTIFSILLISSASSAAFDFDAEMGARAESSPAATSKKSGSKARFDFDAEMGGDSTQTNPFRGQSDDMLGGVMHGRAEVKEKSSLQSFATLSQKLDQTCHCSTTGEGCSGVMSLSSYKTEKYLNKAEGLITKVDELCFRWAENKGQPFSSTEKRNGFIKLWQSNEVKLSSHRDSLADVLGSDAKQYAYLEQQRQQRIEAEQQRAEDKGGFQWGKLAALGVGAAVGGLGNLDSQTQVNVIGGMVMDSMEGQQGISNTRIASNVSMQQIQQRQAENRKIQRLKMQAQAEENRKKYTEANRAYREGAARSEANRRRVAGGQQSSSSRNSSGSYKPYTPSTSPKPNQGSSVPQQKQASSKTPAPAKKYGMTRAEICSYCPAIGNYIKIEQSPVNNDARCEEKGYTNGVWHSGIESNICYNNSSDIMLPNGKTLDTKSCLWMSCYK